MECMMILDRPIGVAGAGSIGCFVGGMLAAAGCPVALLARPRVIGEIEAGGLRLTSFEGFGCNIAANQLTLSEDGSIFGDAGVVLVTVKSADTADMAEIIARNAPSDAVIVSLQNGVGNCRDGTCWGAWCRSMWSRPERDDFIAPPPAISSSNRTAPAPRRGSRCPA
jgi:ketopantoate reductase